MALMVPMALMALMVLMVPVALITLMAPLSSASPWSRRDPRRGARSGRAAWTRRTSRQDPRGVER